MTTRYELRKRDRARFWASVRRWLYGVCIAAVPVAVYFGWLPAEASPVILPLVVALLNVNDEKPSTEEAPHE